MFRRIQELLENMKKGPVQIDSAQVFDISDNEALWEQLNRLSSQVLSNTQQYLDSVKTDDLSDKVQNEQETAEELEEEEFEEMGEDFGEDLEEEE